MWVLIVCVFKNICPLYLSSMYWHKVFVIFTCSPFDVCKIDQGETYLLTAVAQTGDLDCRQSGLQWINSDALVTPHWDYQTKREGQMRYCCSPPLSHSHWILLPEVEEGNRGAMKDGDKMLRLGGSPLAVTHAFILRVQPGTSWPFRRAERVQGMVRLCSNALSLWGRIGWENRHEWALYPNVSK